MSPFLNRISRPLPAAAAQPDSPSSAGFPVEAAPPAASSSCPGDAAVATPCGPAAGLPQAVLDTARRRLVLRGASCLDNAIAFYGPLIGRLRAHLDRRCRDVFDVDIALSAIDSGSTRMLFALFDTLNEGAMAGNRIAVRWRRQGGDDAHCFTFRNTLCERFPLLCIAD